MSPLKGLFPTANVKANNQLFKDHMQKVHTVALHVGEYLGYESIGTITQNGHNVP